MKKILFLLFILTTGLLAQDDVITWGAWTFPPDSIQVVLYDSDTTYVWVTPPNRWDYPNNPRWPIIIEDSTGNKPSNLKIPYSGEVLWNGAFYVGIYPNCGSSSLDSLQISWSPYDNLGNVFTNDVRYLDFTNGTAGLANYVNEWYTSAANDGAYGASSYGETVTTSGIRFMVIQKAASCTDTLIFKFYKN